MKSLNIYELVGNLWHLLIVWRRDEQDVRTNASIKRHLSKVKTLLSPFDCFKLDKVDILSFKIQPLMGSRRND